MARSLSSRWISLRGAYESAMNRAEAARLDADLALVAAVLRLCGDTGSDPSSVLDAIEEDG